MPGIQVDVNYERGLTIEKAPIPRHKSADRARDINEFLQLVIDGWEDYQNRFGIPRADWVPVKYLRPKEAIESPDVKADVILFRIVKRSLANTTPDGNRRPRKPVVREIVPSPDNENETLKISGLNRENLIEFQIWSKHSKNANNLALQFEAFIEAYLWYFTDRGINRVWFVNRGEDTVEEIGGTEYSIRPIQYSVVTELIYKEVSRNIESITVRYDAGSELKEEVLNEQTGLTEVSINHH